MELGSGFDIEKDRLARRIKLTALCDAAILELLPRDGETFCNIALRRIAEGMGCRDLDTGMTANEMVSFFEGAWQRAPAEMAQTHAWRGGLAVAAKRYPIHGHVAVIYPVEHCAHSGSWKAVVPVVANVGKTNGILSASSAFPVKEGQPAYFLWGSA